MSPASVPLLETKLHAPQRRRGVVPRDRLDKRLDAAALPSVVLVSAPAGFGKTTLLSERLAGLNDSGMPTAWLSLDRRDSDPTLFWTYVVAALRRAIPDVGADALAMLQRAPVALDAVVTSLLNDVASSAAEIALVFDDYHVIESIEVHESLLFLVEHLPASMHLIVASRADPPWPLARLRARGELLEIRSADLRFDTEETATYLNREMSLELTATDVDALQARTEGWIAALQLAALSLQGRDDPSQFIAGFAGDDRFVVDYLVDEVLDRQSEETRSFLIQTSILSRLSAPLCAAVTGHSDARELLATLERSNLFVVALDDRRQWFRYHHLFADVLRSRLADQPRECATALHRRASDWFDQHGEPAEAIRHALAAEDAERAAELIELGVEGARQARQDTTLRGWMDALPENVFARRPVLNLARVGSHMVTGDVKGVAALLDEIEGWLDPERATDEMIVHDRVEFARLPAQTAMYRAALALLSGDLASTAEHGARAATLSAPDDHLGRGAAAALIGLAQWAEGDLASAAHQYSAAIREFDSAAYYADILGCSLGLADMQAGLGQLSGAEATLTAGLELAAAYGPLRGTADMHVGLAEVHLERNELAKAAEHLRASHEVDEALALPQHAHRWRVVDARLRSIAGDHEGALELLREAGRRYNTDYSPKARPVSATIARTQFAAGDLGAAQRWAAAAELSVDDETTYLREYEHLTFAHVLLASGRPTDAMLLLQRVREAAEAGGRAGSAIEAQLLLALAHEARGDTARALVTLAHALTAAEPEGFRRIFLDAGAPMTSLLKAAVRHDRAADAASSLLAAAATSTQVHPPSVRQLVDELSSRERDVLRLLRTELTGPEIAAELVVSVNTVRTHTKNIFSKLGVSNRRAAVRRADELGI